MTNMTPAEEKLQKYFDKLLLLVENTSQNEEDSILLAGAMMAASRVLFYEHLNAKEAQNLFDQGGLDLIELVKPTIH